jgi:hypothetical protein
MDRKLESLEVLPEIEAEITLELDRADEVDAEDARPAAAE